jgi:hypothetical protein
MSLQTALQDVEGWAKDALGLAEGAVTAAVPVVGAVDDGLKVIEQVTMLLNKYRADLDTPAMVNATSAQKLQAFHDRVNKDLRTGNEADLESQEAST